MFIMIPGLLGLRNAVMVKRERQEGAFFGRYTLSATLLPGLGRLVKRLPLAFARISRKRPYIRRSRPASWLPRSNGHPAVLMLLAERLNLSLLPWRKRA